MKSEKPEDIAKAMAKTDRRKAQRYNTALPIKVRFQGNETPIDGSATGIGPNGMRLRTETPLLEAQFVNITFEDASNNTHCEGRVVWTRKAEDSDKHYESGIDIQRWGGGAPGSDFIHSLPIEPERDRRKKPRA